MRKIVILLISALMLSGSLSAATYTSIASGDWGDNSTWDLGSVPGNSDNVIILSGHSIDFDQDDKVRSLTIQLGGSLIGDKELELMDDLLVSGYMEIKEIKKADNIEVSLGGTLKVTDKIEMIKDDLTVHGIMEVKEIKDVDNVSIASGGSLKVTDKIEEIEGNLIIDGYLEVKELKEVKNLTVNINGTLKVTDKLEDIKGLLLVNGIVEANEITKAKHVDIATAGTLTITDAGNEMEIKKHGTLNISGTMSIGKLKINDKANAITIDGVLTVSDELENKKVQITGFGQVYAADYKDFDGNPASVYGVGNPVDGQTYYGGAHWKEGLASTDWNNTANWETGTIPTSTIPAIIRNETGSYPIISTAGNQARYVVIEEGSLVIAPGGDLTVAEGITNSVGNSGVVIQSTSSGSGSLIYTTGTPSVTVQRHVPSNANHFVAPMTDASTANDFYIASFFDTWLSYHTESSNAWAYITDLSTVLSIGQGYSYWVEGSTPSHTVEFTGTLTATDQNAVLSYTGDEGDQGWNLLGNPFSSALDWDNGTWGTNDDGTVYVWDINYNTTGDYRSWNGSTGALTDGIIPMGQGFFVKSTAAGNFTIPEAARVHDVQAFYKSANDNDPTKYVRLQLDGDGFGNTVFVGFPENGSDNFDYRGDASKLYSSSETPQLFVTEKGVELCINANTPLTEAGKTVAMNLVQVVDGNYTLTISDLNQLPEAAIVIEDLQTGLTQNLSSNPIYSFSASSTDAPERFQLHFAYSPTGIGEDFEETTNINIYAKGKDIYIRSIDDAINQPGNVYVYDIMGREIAQQQIGYGDLMKLTVSLNNAYAVVKVVKEGTIKTEKVFIK